MLFLVPSADCSDRKTTINRNVFLALIVIIYEYRGGGGEGGA